MNRFKTLMLMTGLMILAVVLGQSLGGRQGMIIAFAMAVIMNFSAYWWSDKIVLAMHRAKPVSESEAPDLYRIVRTLALSAHIPTPKIYLIPSAIPNAFATGRNPHHAAVGVTEGILDILDTSELSGVLAHELAHVKNRDVLISTIAATFAGVIMMLSRMAQWAAFFGGTRRDDGRGGNPLALLVAIVVAPLAASLIQLAISRSREYAADAHGAKICGDPRSLARALKKIQDGAAKAQVHGQRPLGTPATSHLYIVNPFRGGDALMKLFSTHPPLEDRIKRLEAMA